MDYKKLFKGEIVRYMTDYAKTWKYAIVTKDVEPVETCVPVIPLRSLNKVPDENKKNVQYLYLRYCTIEPAEFEDYVAQMKAYLTSQIEHHEKMIKETRQLVRKLKHDYHHFEKETKESIKTFRESC